jgi:hypothetical protein
MKIEIIKGKDTPVTQFFSSPDITPETYAAWKEGNAIREWTCCKLEQERDEAKEQTKELIYIAERAIDLAEIDFENDKFGVVSELRDGVERIKEGAK